jgi:secreted trypsin-like serine protease
MAQRIIIHEYDNNVQRLVRALLRIRQWLVWSMMLLPMVFLAPSAYAVIVGKAPDTPALHVDPNVPASPWAGVGSLIVGNEAYSGVLIGPRHVLTAAHVVSGARAGNIVFQLNANGSASHRIAVVALHIHPEYRSSGAGGVALNDLAIVELAVPAPAGVPVYELFPAVPPLGTRLTIVGYGATGDGIRGVSAGSSSRIKRVGANVIESYIPHYPLAPRAYGFDFDSPEVTASIMHGGTLGNEVEVTLASGDSGSPAFINVEGRWLLAGINTFVANASGGPANTGVFGTLGGGMLVSSCLGWITRIVKQKE